MPNETAVVVGAGGISKAWFGPLQAEHVDVRAVVDLDADRAREAIRHWQLDAEARAEGKRQRQQRKRQPKPRRIPAAPAERPPSVNVADLKRRIYNPHVSRENVIKALEALPPAERRATIAGLPPGLRRKLGGYLKGRGG